MSSQHRRFRNQVSGKEMLDVLGLVLGPVELCKVATKKLEHWSRAEAVRFEAPVEVVGSAGSHHGAAASSGSGSGASDGSGAGAGEGAGGGRGDCVWTDVKLGCDLYLRVYKRGASYAKGVDYGRVAAKRLVGEAVEWKSGYDVRPLSTTSNAACVGAILTDPGGGFNSVAVVQVPGGGPGIVLSDPHGVLDSFEDSVLFGFQNDGHISGCREFGMAVAVGSGAVLVFAHVGFDEISVECVYLDSRPVCVEYFNGGWLVALRNNPVLIHLCRDEDGNMKRSIGPALCSVPWDAEVNGAKDWYVADLLSDRDICYALLRSSTSECCLAAVGKNWSVRTKYVRASGPRGGNLCVRGLYSTRIDTHEREMYVLFKCLGFSQVISPDRLHYCHPAARGRVYPVMGGTKFRHVVNFCGGPFPYMGVTGLAYVHSGGFPYVGSDQEEEYNTDSGAEDEDYDSPGSDASVGSERRPSRWQMSVVRGVEPVMGGCRGYKGTCVEVVTIKDMDGSKHTVFAYPGV